MPTSSDIFNKKDAKSFTWSKTSIPKADNCLFYEVRACSVSNVFF